MSTDLQLKIPNGVNFIQQIVRQVGLVGPIRGPLRVKNASNN